MQQRFLAVTAHFPGHSRKRRDAAAVLANFNHSGGGKLLEGGLQLSSEFHDKIIDEIRKTGTIFCRYYYTISNLRDLSGPPGAAEPAAPGGGRLACAPGR